MKPRFLFLALLLGGQAALAGGARSPDGQAEAQAWFVNRIPQGRYDIRYCVRAARAADKREMEDLVDFAVQEWTDLYWGYISNPVNLPNTSPNDLRPRELSTRFSRCTGREDLTVYYGVEDARVRAAKKLYDDPLGFAHLERFDGRTGNGRGFLWISGAPEVRSSFAHRRELLLHEMGHVYGVPHVDGTVMEASLAEKITAAYHAGHAYEPASPRLEGDSSADFPYIEFENTLVGWTEPEFRNLSYQESGDAGAKISRVLTGTTLTTPFTLDFNRDFNWGRRPGTLPELGRLELRGVEGEPIVFRIEYGDAFWLPLGDERLFLRRLQGQEEFVPRRARILPGELIDLQTGRRTSFLLSRSRHDSFEFDLVVNGERIRL